MQLQRLTTRACEAAHLEVAIAALVAATADGSLETAGDADRAALDLAA